MSSFKRTKLETRLNKTLDSLLVERKALIPPLTRDNEPLQSTSHAEDTGHEDAAPLGEEELDCGQIGIRRVDIPALLDGVEIHAEYDDGNHHHFYLCCTPVEPFCIKTKLKFSDM